MIRILCVSFIMLSILGVEPMSVSGYEDKLNRVQPGVRVASVLAGGEPDVVRVSVDVAAAEVRFGREGGGRLIRTGVYDVRLFRDGHLVGRWPEPVGVEATEPDPTSKDQMAAWRDANRIAVEPDGTATRTFTVRLPHREKPGPVEFTAYAFNEDRVKSATATARYDAPARPLSGKPRAYLVSMGVTPPRNGAGTSPSPPLMLGSWPGHWATPSRRRVVMRLCRSCSRANVAKTARSPAQQPPRKTSTRSWTYSLAARSRIASEDCYPVGTNSVQQRRTTWCC